MVCICLPENLPFAPLSKEKSPNKLLWDVAGFLLPVSLVASPNAPLVEYWSNFFLLWIIFGPCNVALDQMMMMMIALDFDGNANRFHNGLRMIVSMVLDRNMDADPKLSHNKKKISHIILRMIEYFNFN